MVDITVWVAEPRAPANNSKLTIQIPALSMIHETSPVTEDEPGQCTFCLIKYHAAMVKMMEHHFCAHLLIPGYSTPTPEGIKAWAVKQIYKFCVLHDLTNLWAYLWENWY